MDPSFQSLNCTAPLGYGSASLTVNVTGLVTSASFEYDPPSLMHVSPTPVDAMSSSSVVQVHFGHVASFGCYGSSCPAVVVEPQILGNNFGLPQHPTPGVYIGPNICQSVFRVNTSFIQCTATSSAIGRMVVNVSLGGLYSQEPLFIDRMCGEGRTGLLGHLCGPCPSVSIVTVLCGQIRVRSAATMMVSVPVCAGCRMSGVLPTTSGRPRVLPGVT